MASFSLSSSSSRHPRFDTIIGLDVAGKMFYCRKSTLLGESDTSYFAARFGPDSMMDPLRDRIDQNNREIYFVDRNPEMFRYVLEYMRMHVLPPEIGKFGEKPCLWRALRKEAEFFSLDGLTALLKVTFSCSPDDDGRQGILHWLGRNKGREEYINPYRRGAIDVTGWFDSYRTLGENDPSWGSSESKEFFVQYKSMSEKPLSYSDVISPGDENAYFPCLSGCGHSNQRRPVVVDFRKNAISPTHYSLRYGACRGMDGNWTFEASNDGESWVVLHEGRKSDGHNLTYERITQRKALGEDRWFQELRGTGSNGRITNWPEVYCDYMERHYRHTWELKSNNLNGGGKKFPFFRYFRIIGADPVDETGGCLHCIGLEIYGSVYEE